MASPLSIFDVEVFADEEAERAEGAEDEQEEGGEELSVNIVLSVLYCVVAEILNIEEEKGNTEY